MTSSPTPVVLVVGAGIGGLCLAHGLRAAGIPVRVIERTRSRTDWVQGYRIHIDPHGSTALRSCLSPGAWQSFLDAVSDQAGGFAFHTEQLARLLELPDAAGRDPDPARRHHGVSRIALREVLLTDLDGVVEFDRTFDHYTVGPNGTVTAICTDDTAILGDLLVGADGANSTVRRQLLPHARRIDTGVRAVAGKYRLDRADRPALPDVLTRGAVTVLPRRHGFMFSAVWRADPTRLAATPAGTPPGFLFDTRTDYVFWAYADAATAFPRDGDLFALSGGQLQQLVAEEINHWASALRQLVTGSEPDTVNALRVRSAEPVEPWAAGTVTLLGDAIHNMTPMAGIGANTALRDADLLRRELIGVRDGELSLSAAVARYERQMLDYGFKAVARSLRNARLAGSSNRLQRAALRTALRTLDHIPLAKARMTA